MVNVNEKGWFWLSHKLPGNHLWFHFQLSQVLCKNSKKRSIYTKTVTLETEETCCVLHLNQFLSFEQYYTVTPTVRECNKSIQSITLNRRWRWKKILGNYDNYWGKTDQPNGLYNRGGVLYPFGVVDMPKCRSYIGFIYKYLKSSPVYCACVVNGKWIGSYIALFYSSWALKCA